MGTLWIKDFRLGLDARKGELALRPGTLVTAKNGYITQGGEFQGRKSFAPPTAASLPSGCFGLQDTSFGLYTFGSDATPAGFPNFLLKGPQNLNYQRLQHPAVLAGTAYDAAKHAMTAALVSEKFGGYPWVVATFADGRSYTYYGIPTSAGAPVYDFIDGLVLPDRATTALIATDLIAMINRITALAYTATSPGASLLNITGPLDSPYTLGITKVTSAGTLTQSLISDVVASKTGTVATGGVNVVAGSTTSYAISSISRTANVTTVNTTGNHGLANNDKVVVRGVTGTGFDADDVTVTVVDPDTFTYANTGSNGSGSGGTVYTNYIAKVEVNNVTITNAAIPFTTDNIATAALVAANINNFVSTPDYIATASQGRITIAAAVTGITANALVVSVTARGTVCCGDFTAQFQGTSYNVTTMPVDGVNILSTTFHFGPGQTYLTLAALATAIQDDINNNTLAGTAHGYLAYAAGNALYFSKAVTTSSDTALTTFFTITVDATYVGSILYNNPINGAGFVVSVSPTTFNIVSKLFGTGNTGTPTIDCTVFTTADPSTYSYQWRRLEDAIEPAVIPHSYNVNALSPTSRTTKFQLGNVAITMAAGSHISVAKFVCDVTDLLGVTVTTNVVSVNVNSLR